MTARKVHTHLEPSVRGCLFCLSPLGPFESEEHVIPRALGDHREFVLPAGVVCDPCNNFLGRQVDAPFLDRFDVRLTRGIEDLRGRRGTTPQLLEGRNPTVQLDFSLQDGGPAVRIMAERADETEDGGLDIEIDPVIRDPPDIVARTLRALWKMALGGLYLQLGRKAALAGEWDPLRLAVLGARFTGFVLQRPFELRSTRRLQVGLDLEVRPRRVRFEMGGVILAAPLDTNVPVPLTPVVEAGWQVLRTEAAPPPTVLLRLDPNE